MFDKLAEIGQRLERIKSNIFVELSINREEGDDQSSRSVSVGAYSEHSNSEQEKKMADNDDDNRALEDYAQPVIPNSPWCILLPVEARNYDLKSSHFHMLLSFHGLPNEDLLAHIKEFYNVVTGLPFRE